MQTTYNVFYKQYGVLRSNQIVFPRVFDVNKLSFPLNSVFHFLEHKEGVIGPEAATGYFQGYAAGALIIEHMEEIHSSQGLTLQGFVGKRQVQRFSSARVQEYQRKHKAFKYQHEAHVKDKNGQHLVIVNYNFPTELYQYNNVPMADYQQWADLEQTLWDEALVIAHESNRHQFRIIEVPDILPSISTLNANSKGVTASTLKVLDQPEKWFILELWKWLKQDNGRTWWRDWTMADFDKMNLVFRHQEKWFLLNMGYWYSFFESVPKEEVHSLNHDKLKFKPIQMQKYMMRMLMQVQASSTVQLDTDAVRTSDVESELTENKVQPIIDMDLVQPDETALDEELSILETIEKRSVAQKLSSSSHAGLVEGDDEAALAENHKRLLQDIQKEHSVVDQLKTQIEEQAEYGLMSAADYRKLMKDAERYTTSYEPYGLKDKVSEFVKVDPAELAITQEEISFPPTSGVVDSSMLSCSTQVLDKKYIEKGYLKKDIINAVYHIQKAGVVVQDHEVTEYVDAMGNYEQHRLKVKPIDGVSSTLTFRIPKINSEGEFVSGGIKYRARRQKVDLPIRKIDDRTVVLASYYSKLFVQRSEKKAYDLYDWMARKIIETGMSNPNGLITNIAPADVFDNLFTAPRSYSGLAKYIKSVVINGDFYTFDHKQRESLFGPDILLSLEQEGRRLIGYTKAKEPLALTPKNTVEVYRNKAWALMGDWFTVLQVDPHKAPLDYIELKIFTKSVPIGLVLAYYLGLSRLLALLKVKPNVVPSNKRVVLAPDEWAITFKDEKLIFSRTDPLVSLVLGGFKVVDRVIRGYHRASFDQTNVYLNVLDTVGITARLIRELQLLDQLFVDPITMEVLQEMNEPVTFQGLLYRASELLLVDYHPDLQDMRYKRIRSYERVAGAIYKELALSVREYKNRNIRSRPQMEMNPYAVWKNVSSQNDTAVKPPADINPLMYLKEMEAITIAGVGGQDKGAVVKKARAYHPSEIGTTSEATSDSGDVGINTYVSANPRFKSLRGVVDTNYDFKTDGATSLFSSQILLAPGSDRDSSTRLMMVGIQHAHTVACKGYHQPYVRTGYEPILAKRMGGMFGFSAPEDGKVVEVSEEALVVELVSGKRLHIPLGRQYGRSEGTIYPQDMTTHLKAGLAFKKSQVLAYNPGFFEPDHLDAATITWKSGMTVTTALMEVSQTFEDSSAISKALSEKLESKTTKLKSYTVEFNQAVRNVIKAGTEVTPMSILLLIEDAVTNEAGLFDDDTLQTLQKLSNHAPRAKVKGTVDRIEVYYHGDKADMSASLKALADQSDKRMAERCKLLQTAVVTGRVNGEYRVEGTPLGINKAEIQIYITVSNGAGVGDKGVFANQMKTTFGEIMSYPVTTESGMPVDAIFGYRSITARIVTSPLVIGTTTTLLKVIGQKAVSLYHNAMR